MARGDSLSRQLQLCLMLLDERELSVDATAQRLGCTRRTIYRDLQVLERAGMPIYQEQDGRRVRWRLVEGFQKHLSIQFTIQEAMALVAGQQFLAALAGSVFAEAAQSAVAKVRHALAPPLKSRLDRLAKNVSANSSTPARQLKKHRAHLDTLLAAVEASTQVRLIYCKLNSTRAEHYTVEPHHLHVQGSSVYLVAWTLERSAARIFLLDRVESAEPTDVVFARRPELGPGAFAQGAFGLWDGKDQIVRLVFLGDAATIVSEQEFHSSQRMTRNDDGSLTLELKVPISPSLKAWVRGFGQRVQVLTPKTLLNDL